MTDELSRLMAEARALPPMTREQREEQHLDFAYGNLALTKNHKPSLAAFRAISVEMGWSLDRFYKWAAGREWWQR